MAEREHAKIPEHVRRQAMDAVSHRETTAHIRSFQTSGTDVSPDSMFSYRQEPRQEVRPIPDAVKRQAMDAVSHPETTSQIRLMRDNGRVTPPNTPARETDQVAGKVSRLHHEGHGLDATQKTITQDGFGREYV